MKHAVLVREQVKLFLEQLALESRRKIRLALRKLEHEQGDRVSLRERLSGYHRLRVGSFRIVYRYQPGRVVECVFAQERSVVYKLFEMEFREHLRKESSE